MRWIGILLVLSACAIEDLASSDQAVTHPGPPQHPGPPTDPGKPPNPGPSCPTGFGNCDGIASNLCETPLDTVDNCGACSNHCAYVNASAACAVGVCALGSCSTGYGNCDLDSATGCETDFVTDPTNCGACGNACGAGATCTNGACEPILTCTSQTLTDTFNVSVWDYYGLVRAQYWNYQSYAPFDSRLGTLERVTVEQSLNVDVDQSAAWYGDTYSFRMTLSGGGLWASDSFPITTPSFTKHYTYVFDQNPDWTDAGWGYYFESVALVTPHVVTNTAVLTYCYRPNRRVFVTSTFYDGNLGGLAGADTKCQARAQAAGLTGTYKAWLSDDTTSAGGRLEHAVEPYILVDGTVVATDWNQLASNFIAHPIDKTELGGPPTVIGTGCGSYAGVFTGTGAPNAYAMVGQTCESWTSSSSDRFALIGHALEANSHWTNLCSWEPCSTPTPLYCIEQR